MASHTTRAFPLGASLLCLAAFAALTIAAINAFNEGNGIAFTPGAYLVLGSSALLLVGALVLALRPGLPRPVAVTFALLVLLDILGTAVAAYLLEAGTLLAVMGVAALAWFVRLARDPSGHPRPRDAAEQGA